MKNSSKPNRFTQDFYKPVFPDFKHDGPVGFRHEGFLMGKELKRKKKQPTSIVWLSVKQCRQHSTENNRDDTFLCLIESPRLTRLGSENAIHIVPEVLQHFFGTHISSDMFVFDFICSLTDIKSCLVFVKVTLKGTKQILLKCLVFWFCPLIMSYCDRSQ